MQRKQCVHQLCSMDVKYNNFMQCAVQKRLNSSSLALIIHLFISKLCSKDVKYSNFLQYAVQKRLNSSLLALFSYLIAMHGFHQLCSKDVKYCNILHCAVQKPLNCPHYLLIISIKTMTKIIYKPHSTISPSIKQWTLNAFLPLQIPTVYAPFLTWNITLCNRNPVTCLA